MCESNRDPNRFEHTVVLQGSGAVQETASKSDPEPGGWLLQGASICDSKESTPKSSPKRIEANRRNAQKSTGPKTERGKAQVRFNALKHGLLAKPILQSGDDEERKEFEHLLTGLRLDFQPVGELESLDVQDIAVRFWKKRRALRWETRQLRQTSDEFVQNQQRIYASIKEKLLAAIDTNSEVGTERELGREKTNVLGEGMPNVDVLNAIVRYEAANDRILRRTLIHLERLQRTRKGECIPAPVSISLED